MTTTSKRVETLIRYLLEDTRETHYAGADVAIDPEDYADPDYVANITVEHRPGKPSILLFEVAWQKYVDYTNSRYKIEFEPDQVVHQAMESMPFADALRDAQTLVRDLAKSEGDVMLPEMAFVRLPRRAQLLVIMTAFSIFASMNRQNSRQVDFRASTAKNNI
jgi:hypothetical protein